MSKGVRDRLDKQIEIGYFRVVVSLMKARLSETFLF